MVDKTKHINMKEYLKLNAIRPASVVDILKKVSEEVSILHEVGMKHGDINMNIIYITQSDNQVNT